MRRRMDGGWKARVKNVCWAESWAEVLWYRPEKKRNKNRLFRFTHGSHIIQTERQCSCARVWLLSLRCRLFCARFLFQRGLLLPLPLQHVAPNRDTAQPIRFYFNFHSSFVSMCGESKFYVCSIFSRSLAASTSLLYARHTMCRPLLGRHRFY